jgi:hypothetical protein
LTLGSLARDDVSSRLLISADRQVNHSYPASPFAMFPTKDDISDFAIRFGNEGHLSRSLISHLNVHGTTVAAVIAPERTPEETLAHTWRLLQSLAEWVIQRAANLPPTERYMLIVGWSKSVREMQGQIFKAGGTIENVREVVASPDWEAWERASGYRALLPNWQKDVFAQPAG